MDNTIIINYLFLAIMTAIFIKIAYCDYRTKFIYVSDLVALAIVVILYKLFNDDIGASLLAGAAAYAFGYAIYIVSYWYYGEEAFGSGDVYLLGILGCYWSWPTIVHFIYFLFIFAAFFGIVLLAITRDRKYPVAFGPILIISVFIYHMLGLPEIYSIIANMCI